ncbi:MAG: Lrp/AsnC ligand binding domain-containing protein [Thaumarchaeota archaeon]|nr:Lrp/AsnC ligand binding domain-containing protein [Nitrososphaerota archaeon]
MSTAFVLINCEAGSEEDILEKLKSIIEVKITQRVTGPYDIVAKIDLPDEKDLRDVIAWKIRIMKNVMSTLTLKVKN